MKADQVHADSGKGCLSWAARIPAAGGILVLVASVIDIIQGGPVLRWQVNILLAIAVPVIVIFVYLDALVEADFDGTGAIRRMPRAFARNALLLGVVALYAWASNLGTGTAAAGGAPTGGRAVTRTNRASDLIDTDVFAAALGVRSVRAAADGLNTSYMTRATAYGADTPGRMRPQISITVYEGALANARWAKVARTFPATGEGRVGDAAYGSGDKLYFKRGSSVVFLRIRAYHGDTAQKLVELAAAIDKRLAVAV